MVMRRVRKSAAPGEHFRQKYSCCKVLHASARPWPALHNSPSESMPAPTSGVSVPGSEPSTATTAAVTAACSAAAVRPALGAAELALSVVTAAAGLPAAVVLQLLFGCCCSSANSGLRLFSLSQ